MKKIFALATGLMLLGSASAMAQDSDAPSTVQRIKVMYDLNTLYPKDASNAYFNGVGAGYSIDFRVSRSLPLYVGTGLDLRAVFNDKDILTAANYDAVEIEAKSSLVNLNVPVNVSYRVPVADGFYLTPQLGLDFRVQVYGHTKLEGEIDLPYGDDIDIADRSINLFSKEDMGDEHLRRFQFGWHAAVDFEYRRFDLGLSFGTDFVKLHKNLGGSNFLVSLGYRF